MDVERVRSFNRTVTERVGALQDAYLASDRPLGADRVLWEIGDGTDLRALRNAPRPRLRLPEPADRRRSSAKGWSRPRPATDKRVREVTPDRAPAGRERALLDRRSDELARSVAGAR